MKKVNLEGMIPAAVLPMDPSFTPRFDAYSLYVDWLIGQDAVAIAVNMDTGEGPQLSREERRMAIQTAVETANGRVPIVAGIGGSTTAVAVEEARLAKQAGAEALIVFPNAAFRNDPLDPRIPVEYHKAIADEGDLPVVLFQLAPVFGGVNYTRETLLGLLEIPQVAAIKEASFDLQYFIYTTETLKLSSRHITLLTGNDRFITESIMLGAVGGLLGFGAVGCKMIAQMLSLAAAGDFKGVVELRPKLQAFASCIYCDPVLDYRARCKMALSQIGVFGKDLTYVRPPLLRTSDEEAEKVFEALVAAGMVEAVAG